MRTLAVNLARARQVRVMTQAELAERVGCDSHTVGRLERAAYGEPTMSLLTGLATVLQVPVGYLLGETIGGAIVKEQDRKLLLPIRKLLLVDIGTGREPQQPDFSYETTRQRLVTLTDTFNRADYNTVLERLPDFMTTVETVVDAVPENERGRWFRLQAHAYILTAQTLIHLRSEDLAIFAIKKAVYNAELAGDAVLKAAASMNYSWAFIRQGMYDEAQNVAIHAADAIQPSVTSGAPDRVAVWGLLYTEASRAACYADRIGEAKELMLLAHGAAVRLPDVTTVFERFWAIFNPSVIGIARVGNAMTAGDAKAALIIARDVHRASDAAHSDRWVWHLMNVAEAYRRTGDGERAIETVKGFHRLAPQWSANRREAHDLVRELLGSVSVRRARSSGLAEVGRAMGVEP